MLEKLAMEEKVLSRLVGGGSTVLMDVLICRVGDWGGRLAVATGEDMNAEKSSSSSNSDVGCF